MPTANGNHTINKLKKKKVYHSFVSKSSLLIQPLQKEIQLTRPALAVLVLGNLFKQTQERVFFFVRGRRPRPCARALSSASAGRGLRLWGLDGDGG